MRENKPAFYCLTISAKIIKSDACLSYKIIQMGF